MDWLLMNRDTPLLYFCSSIDLYGDTLVQEKAWLSPLRPLGYPGLWKFLPRRRASMRRKHGQAPGRLRLPYPGRLSAHHPRRLPE